MLSRKQLVTIILIVVVAILIYVFFRRSSEELPKGLREADLNEGNQAQIEPKKEWKKYVSQNGQFTVLLPAMPQFASEVVPLSPDKGYIKYDMYLSRDAKSGSTFMISIIQYPQDFDTASADSILDGVMKEMLAGNANNQLDKSQKRTFKNYPSLTFSIMNQDYALHCEAFLIGKKLYVLTMIDRNGQTLDVLFQKFLDSFQLNEKQ